MKRQILSIGLILFTCVALLSCKGDKGDVGPAGPAGSSDQDFSTKEGFVKGTASGNLLSGAGFNYAFDFQGVDEIDDNSYEVRSSEETIIYVYKSYAGDGTSFENASISFSINVNSLSDLSTSPELDNVNLYFKKDLGGNKFHYGSYYYSSFDSQGKTATVSNLVYNSTTGVLTGNYTFSAPATSYYGSISIANGTFSTKLSQQVTRKAAQ